AREAKRGDRPRGRTRDRELTPEERARRAARKAARQADRRREGREERHARRRARQLEEREGQWAGAVEEAPAEGGAAPARPKRARGPKDPVEVFTSTGSGMPKLRIYLHQLRKRRSLIWHLARSDLKGENYNTFFGQVWLILNPLMLAGVYIL